MSSNLSIQEPKKKSLKTELANPATVFRPALLQRKSQSEHDFHTVVIFGAPRGGTTMVAGVVQRCGIDIGKELPKNLEDQSFVQKPIEKIKEAIAERNSNRRTWGWKHPIAVSYLAKISDELVNPRYIIVWRDPLAVSIREARAGLKLPDAIGRAIRQQMNNLIFLRKTKAPFLLISYEKALARPVELAQMISEFVGGTMPSDVSELQEFMTPGKYKEVKDFSTSNENE